MKAHQATYPVRVMSRLLGVSASGFYAWLKRPPSRRALQDIALTARIRAIHCRSGEAYGAPSIHAELADDHGVRIGRKRVARFMRAAGLKGVPPPKFVSTTIADAESDRALDKVDRRFSAEGPDRLWVADVTYVPTWAGFCISPLCWMRGPGASLAGRWLITSRRRSCSMRWGWRSHSAARSRSSIIRIAAANTPAMRSASVAARPAWCPPWDPRETLTITRWPRVSLRHWSVKSSTVDASRAGPRHAWRSSPGWKAGTSRTGAIPHSVTCHPSITRGKCYKELLRPQALNRPRKRGKTRIWLCGGVGAHKHLPATPKR